MASFSRTRAIRSPFTIASRRTRRARCCRPPRCCWRNMSDLPIELLPGKFMIEVKQVGFDKATGVRELMKFAPFTGRRPVLLGDDVTDESMFTVAPEYDGIAISVGACLTGVSYHFDKPIGRAPLADGTFPSGRAGQRSGSRIWRSPSEPRGRSVPWNSDRAGPDVLNWCGEARLRFCSRTSTLSKSSGCHVLNIRRELRPIYMGVEIPWRTIGACRFTESSPLTSHFNGDLDDAVRSTSQWNQPARRRSGWNRAPHRRLQSRGGADRGFHSGRRAGGRGALAAAAAAGRLVRLERQDLERCEARHHHHRARQSDVRSDRPVEERLCGILQRLREPGALADPALPSRPRRVPAPRPQRLPAGERAFRQRASPSCCATTTSIWVHDYHLIPLAKMLRERGHRNRIGFFLHIPCPPPEILTALPNHESLIPQLGDYDLVGFQTEGDANNCARYFEYECGYRPLERVPLPDARTADPDRRLSDRHRDVDAFSRMARRVGPLADGAQRRATAWPAAR